MKYIILAISIFTSQCFAGLVFSPNNTDITVGDNVTIDVSYVNDNNTLYTEIIGFDFNFSFDDTLAGLDSLTLAEPFASNGDWGIDILGDYVFAGNYSFDPAINPFDNSKQQWDILSFSFNALAAGPFSLRISQLVLTDYDYSAIEVADASTSVNISPPVVAASAPHMLALLLLALIGMAITRQKHR